MNTELDKDYELDLLAAKAGGYVKPMSEEDRAFTELLLEVCKQFGVRYYSADAKDRYFVEEVARVTWERQQEKATGIKVPIRPAFSAPAPEESAHPKIPEIVMQAASLMAELSEADQRTTLEFIRGLVTQ
ncbi:MAG: hypothetical protein NC081_05480 [Roseburia sp.]|nr:hypothetical protein [Lachnospiraceae bacterium]MCM1568884.1 hypothetical protein [Roseburia sp.]